MRRQCLFLINKWNIIMRKQSNLILFVFLSILTPIQLACSYPQWSQSSEQPIEITSSEEDTKLTYEVDRELFRQIKGLGDQFKQNKIWSGYDYSSYPQYLIHTTKSGVDRAFLINPVTVPEGAVLLDSNENQGLSSIYRYDLSMREAYRDLFGPDGNEVFTFNFQIEGKGYYLQAYSDDLTGGMNDPSMTVSYSTHELFHRYQDSWEWVPDSKQDFDNFPLSYSLLELQILCQEVLKDLPNDQLQSGQLKDLLLQYLAIRSAELALDPTADQLIRNHELYQEQMEGSARFIEVMSNQQFFPPEQYEAKFGYSLLEFWVESQEDVRGLVGQSVYYGTGGSVIYLLKRLGIPVERLQEGKTPYDLALLYLNPSRQELDRALKKARNISTMSDIQQTARKWISLK